MTNEEAREILIQIRKQSCVSECDYTCRLYDSEKFCREEKAFDLAIKALEQQSCDDVVSRQAVLDYIEGSGAELGHDSENELVCQDIKALPSVTPQQKVGKWIFHKPFDNGHKNCNECIECSQCHIWLDCDCYVKTPYCPNCGAKMESEDKE